MNFEPIALVCLKSILNVFETCARAPDTSLKSEVYQDFKNLRDVDSFDKGNLFDNHSTFYNKSVLSRAWKLKRDINNWNTRDTWQRMETIDKKEEKHSMPVYLVQFPSNIMVIKEIESIENSINNNDSWNWYSDGSIMKHNYGGFGYTTLQERMDGKLISNYGYINHLTNIDYCELAAIHACLNDN